MLVTFKNPQIHAIFNNDMLLVDKLGAECVKRLYRRLDDLRAAENLADLKHAPGSFTMVSERKGQFICNLDHAYSLSFESHRKPLPKTDNGECDWTAVVGIAIVDLVKQN